MHIHNLIGIGFGPSNLALAIALQEQGHPADALYLERQEQFAWHPDMLLDNTHMQISFLKDLAMLRNPTSRYTFLHYLHQQQRLQDFINLKTFYPSRREFNDYLAWAARQFAAQCHYGEDVSAVLPVLENGQVTHLNVQSRDRHGRVQERLARNIVVSVGGSPAIPDSFAAFKDDERVFHSSAYLTGLARLKDARRIAVIGAGQSAAEIFMDLHGKNFNVDLITRGRAIKPADDSPFINEIFNADYTDYVFHQAPSERAALLDEYHNTNYAVADTALIEQIFNVFYQQKVLGDQRHQFLRRHDVVAAHAEAGGIQLQLNDQESGTAFTTRYDAVILATGYQRQKHHSLLAPLAPWLDGMAVDRHYQLIGNAQFQPRVFLQGGCEASHGLSDTLLSITAIRSQEIGAALHATAAAAAL
ncbi:lysine N(6)-hydroxylase/L-ornithine N(5)-oxygenase family protein [Janthinobacterium fluminis]|uniref:Lysine N(6)-hydroxylase/L-ornithine N(5)-oxygenase family protein n=1 Tax=Janthinobacterium fluminis TaxID=2987524 RepID=A0ABT5K3Y2_9BURK|nr:lysine N(6)-hydroxylase/L-ornithine N(5)-oxygenase family protein [Janthinobacterium fluminis]MDC8759692.1 lysine N(6)-hydroxylase/L-ornithine N(5)-oxygenase family protein [Janthinobacterium fluminis]